MNHEEDDFSNLTVAIIGLGLMGGSLAMALQGKCRSLLVVEKDANVLALANEKCQVDRSSTILGDILPAADLIILATPVGEILATIPKLEYFHPGSPVVMDLGSTKMAICQALSGLPERFDPIGGHPMCGKEKSGLAYADEAIFHGATFAFTPLPRTSHKARSIALKLTEKIGAKPLWVDAETHDRHVSGTSHLPYLISAALSLTIHDEASLLVGPGFRSASRLAASSPNMMLDILRTNRNNLLEIVLCFNDEMNRLENALREENYESLLQWLRLAAVKQERLIRGSAGEIS